MALDFSLFPPCRLATVLGPQLRLDALTFHPLLDPGLTPLRLCLPPFGIGFLVLRFQPFAFFSDFLSLFYFLAIRPTDFYDE
ncbi:hypothetical protein [Massilia genomosp. 1]|uniref:Uncharacterized protein n=1 Tax=Massilia genomosp. 1 TaxID=2609280 RepID=A0ABX0MDC4_9BURK|nr:hypothetical protein [Massilia genomosp. 1]NHZ60758.1 hypothetical protein [Massilia genomosp. 1]